VEDFPVGTVRLVGAVELLAAVGLILPAATGIVPVLTRLAATGLGVTMILAMVVHARRKEPSGIAPNAVLLVPVGHGRLGTVRLLRVMTPETSGW
jgi:hypothetical protein